MNQFLRWLEKRVKALVQTLNFSCAESNANKGFCSFTLQLEHETFDVWTRLYTKLSGAAMVVGRAMWQDAKCVGGSGRGILLWNAISCILSRDLVNNSKGYKMLYKFVKISKFLYIKDHFIQFGILAIKTSKFETKSFTKSWRNFLNKHVQS